MGLTMNQEDKATPLAAKVAEIRERQRERWGLAHVLPTGILVDVDALLAIYPAFEAMKQGLRYALQTKHDIRTCACVSCAATRVVLKLAEKVEEKQ
jgi:hypothetical protein